MSIFDHVMKYAKTFLSIFVGAYRKYVVVDIFSFIYWKNETVLLDLSKAFNCTPHDLLIAKPDAYGFDKKALLLL